MGPTALNDAIERGDVEPPFSITEHGRGKAWYGHTLIKMARQRLAQQKKLQDELKKRAEEARKKPELQTRQTRSKEHSSSPMTMSGPADSGVTMEDTMLVEVPNVCAGWEGDGARSIDLNLTHYLMNEALESDFKSIKSALQIATWALCIRLNRGDSLADGFGRLFNELKPRSKTDEAVTAARLSRPKARPKQIGGRRREIYPASSFRRY